MRVVLYDNQLEILIKILEKIKNTKVNKDTSMEEIVEMSDAAGALEVIKYQIRQQQEQGKEDLNDTHRIVWTER